jgi:hypothetical protein
MPNGSKWRTLPGNQDVAPGTGALQISHDEEEICPRQMLG